MLVFPLVFAHIFVKIFLKFFHLVLLFIDFFEISSIDIAIATSSVFSKVSLTCWSISVPLNCSGATSAGRASCGTESILNQQDF